MRKTLLALAMVLMLAPMASAQQAPSPHTGDVEVLYWAANVSGVDVPIGTTEDVAGAADAAREPKEVIMLKTTNVTGIPFVIRGVYRYKRELAVGGQFYQVSASGKVDKDHASWKNTAVSAGEEIMKGSTDVCVWAVDLFHVQNIARTSESNYDLIGGFRWAGNSMNVVISNKDRTNTPAAEQESEVTGGLFGPHIGIISSKRFLADPLRLKAAITHSLLQGETTAAAKRSQAGTGAAADDQGSWNRVVWTETAPVQVTDVEIALKYSSPRMKRVEGSIGYLSSQWQNVGAIAEMDFDGPTGGVTRRDLSVQGWRIGINYSF